jgi:hypothetical protein
VHHVRRFGEQKSDRRALPMCEGAHLYQASQFSIERIGKVKFEQRFAINLEAEIVEHNTRFEQERKAA